MSERRVSLPGSERRPLPGAMRIEKADPKQELTVTVYVRTDPAAPPLPPLEEYALALPGQRKQFSDAEIEAMTGASEADLDAVEKFGNANGLEIVQRSRAKRSVELRGTVEAMSKAFGVDLDIWQHDSRRFRARTGAIRVPEELATVITGVFGLDNRKAGRSYRRKALAAGAGHTTSGLHGYLPTEVAQAYHYPPTLDGSGQCLAIMAFNGTTMDLPGQTPGGYSHDVVNSYFRDVIGIQPPTLVDVTVRGPGNVPGPMTAPDDSTGEILLDVQVAGSVAPGAKIVVYFTEFTEQGWVDALTHIVNDTVNRPSVISISYGNSETLSNAGDPNTRGSLWTNAAIEHANSAFQVAALRNITICCASGDDGSTDQVSDGLAHADFPASSPFVLGCGGTRLVVSNGTIHKEAVWNDDNLPSGGAGGGGISDLFGLPTWQDNVGVPPSVNPGHRIGRGVPDVSGDADYMTGMIISDINGNVDRQHPTGGTSATAPLWAALIARLNQGVGAPLGFMNPLLYMRFSSGVLRDIVKGNNGRYMAAAGWDACTGLGSPDGVKLLQAFSGASPVHAVTPNTEEAESRVRTLENRVSRLEDQLNSGVAVVLQTGGEEIETVSVP